MALATLVRIRRNRGPDRSRTNARPIAIASGGRFARTRNALRLLPAQRLTHANVPKGKAETIRAATADRAPLFRTKPISTLRICIAMSARKRETIPRNARTAKSSGNAHTLITTVVRQVGIRAPQTGLTYLRVKSVTPPVLITVRTAAAVAVVAHPVQKDRLRPEPFQTEARFTSRPAVRLGMPLNPQVA